MSRQDKWDLRFLRMARLVASWSKDPRRKTGAVIVRPDLTVASMGFNGFPSGMRDERALLADKGEKYSRIIHCEMNAVMHSRERLTGYAIYVWPLGPCDRCAAHLLQAGLRRFVFPLSSEEELGSWAESVGRAKGFINETGAEWREIKIGGK